MGDFSANFHRPETGVHTVEGNLAGHRAAALTKKRSAEQADFEARKNRIRSEATSATSLLDGKFDAHDASSSAERDFRARTVGLVTAQEFRRASREAERRDATTRGKDEARARADAEEEKRRARERKKERKKRRRKVLSTLSFADADDAAGMVDDDDDENEAAVGAEASKKNPDVDTSFLPDKRREEEAAAERRRLRAEWLRRQEAVREEALEITYSYWDGSGHRRAVRVVKGDTVGRFLEIVRKDLSAEFREMSKVTADALLYVKEDLIIPQDVTFYDLIATQARGKSGPLFNFDVHDDVRVGAIDVTVEKDESHPGKVVERRWYDRNKHIFPASRWEVYDPAKKYGTYTIHGREVN